MKKIVLTLTLVFSMSFGAFAQRNDGFFKYDEGPYNRLETVDIGLYVPSLYGLGAGQNEPAPLGSGLLILAALGAGYIIRKRKE